MPSSIGFSPLAQTLRELRAEVAALHEPEAEPLTEVLAQLLTAHYAAAARGAVKKTDGALDFKTLRALTADIVKLRHGDHSALRLRQEREWIEIEREQLAANRQDKIEAGLDALAEEIKNEPAARRAYETLRRIVRPASGQRLSEEERAARLREIFGLPREPQRKGRSREALAEIERAARLL